MLGGTALASVSLLVQRSVETELAFENLKLPVLMGMVAIVLPVIAELEDRYKSNPGDSGTGNNGRDDGPDDPPEDPPQGPSGPELELIDEIEAYLRSHEPVLTA